LKWITVTKFRLPFLGRGASSKAIKKALEKDDVVAKWKATSWGKKIVGRQIRSNLNDFERFQFRTYEKQVCFSSLSLSDVSNNTYNIIQILTRAHAHCAEYI
jgi:ribosomal protein L14E/L6E/L27E